MLHRDILITRPLSQQQREFANSLGLNPIEKSALEFEFPVHWYQIIQIIKKHPKSDWVFTSKNGVEALKRMMRSGLQVSSEIHFFTVGNKTRKALQKLGFEAKVPFNQNAKHLAELIVEEGTVDSIIRFRGNLSRPEMSDILISNDIEVIEVEVYRTIIHPVKLPSESLDAILFCSPSAVEGFQKGEGFEQALPPLFAIGPTTADALKSKTNQSVKITGQTSIKALLQSVSSELFQKKEI